eukprot:5915470-Amphidinium_carterae.1
MATASKYIEKIQPTCGNGTHSRIHKIDALRKRDRFNGQHTIRTLCAKNIYHRTKRVHPTGLMSYSRYNREGFKTCALSPKAFLNLPILLGQEMYMM